jgi:hypothetical protein
MKILRARWFSFGAAVIAALWATAASPAEEIRLPIIRDTWVSSYGEEAHCNLGGAPRLKFKSYQEMSLVDIDPAPWKGRVVEAAWLHVCLAGRERLWRVTASSISSPWVEGTSPTYRPQEGSSCFAWREYPKVPWAYPGSDLTAVVLGQGGSLWRMADASDPDAEGWQIIPIDPLVIAARAAGISHGILLFDDTGTEWQRDGERVEFRPFPNRFVFSRHGPGERAPYLRLQVGPPDTVPPPPPAEVNSEAEALPPGEAFLRWKVPEDPPPGRTLGFFVSVNGKAIPQYLVPVAPEPGREVSLHLRDLNLAPGAKVDVEIRAVDAAGNISQPARITVTVSGHMVPSLPWLGGEGFAAITPEKRSGDAGGALFVSARRAEKLQQVVGELPCIGRAAVSVIDEFDKIHPVTGQMIPAQDPEYLLRNHLWDARRKVIALQAARNEFVAFQLVFFGEVRGLRPTVVFDGAARGIRPRFAQVWLVHTKAGPLGDPVVPLSGPVDLPLTNLAAPAGAIPATASTLLCELYVPHHVAPGRHTGQLLLRTGSELLRIDILLNVWNFTLPDYLSFIPEMNCYGLPADEREYYRLAHEHRTVINRLPYSQRGTVAPGCAPGWDGKQLRWEEWDRRFGPLLDGSAFADLPRRGVPVEVFYLPLHENWPTPIDSHYNGSYWADEAFSAEYRQAFVEVSRQFAEHIERRGWHETLFQCFLNNKNYYKRNGWSRGSSPWLLDEPADTQDFWALRYFGEAFHEGCMKASGSKEPQARLVFRCDISRPQWQRDLLDHVLDYNVVAGGAFRRYHRLVIDRRQRFGQILLDYGTTNPVADSNVSPAGWCWDSWTLGSDGIIPWQTIGRPESWRQDDQLALFYPGEAVGLKGPVPSIRLKAYRRGQQDAEYLTLLTRALNQPRWAVGSMIRRELGIESGWEAQAAGEEEPAGQIRFQNLLPQQLWQLRIRVARVIDAAGPAPQRRLVDFRPPRRDPSQAPPAKVSPRPEASGS